MNRREVIFGLAAVAVGLPRAASRAAAQPVERKRRIGFLTLRSHANEYDAAFRRALGELGYVEGRTIDIAYRWAAGSENRAQELAAELVALEVEVIVAATTGAIRAVMRATNTIPIVMAASADPDLAGLVTSIARPGGNVTGLSMVSSDTAMKRLELLRELTPAATRVAVLIRGAAVPGRDEPTNVALVDALQAASRKLGLSLVVVGAMSAADLESALASAQRERAQALIVQASPLTIDHRARIVDLVRRHRLPAMYEVEGFVDAGGLLSYGPSLVDMYRRAAVYVDKVLRGAKPADLPVELPIKYHLAINLRPARALGLRIPQPLLLRADRLVEP